MKQDQTVPPKERKNFVDRVVGHDEELKFVTRVHWVYYIIGLWWMIGMWAIGIFVYLNVDVFFDRTAAEECRRIFVEAGWGINDWTILCNKPSALFWFVAGIYIFILYVFKVISTEAAVTSQRIIYKTGLIFVRVKEVELDEIRAENVYQGMFGQYFDYGRITMDCRLIGDFTLPTLYRPYRFLDHMHTVFTKMEKHPYYI